MKALVRAGVLAAALVIVRAVPAVAQAAATFYAQGGGGNTGLPCTQAEPCNLGKAVNKADEAGGGSAVVLLSGPAFTPGQHLEVAGEVDIGGVPGEPRPTIFGPGDEESLILRGGALMHDANIVGGDNSKTGFSTLQLNHASAERVYVEGTWGAGCQLRSGSMRDSVCVSEQGAGIVAGDFSDPAVTVSLRNVDAMGREAGIVAITPVEPTTQDHIEGVNTIAVATADQAGDDDIIAGTGTGGTALVEMRNSAYDSVLTLDPGDSVTPPGTNGNITASPQFVDFATGDLHQSASSPTVDAGSTEAANGELDLDLDPRALSAHPTCDSAAGPTDIGAYEYVAPLPICAPPPGGGGDKSAPPPPPPVPPAPGTALKKAKIDKSKGTATFTFGGIGTVSGFRCELVRPAPTGAKKAKGKRAKPRFTACRSPQTYKHLGPGRYTFEVAATGPGGTDATPVKRGFAIGGGAP